MAKETKYHVSFPSLFITLFLTLSPLYPLQLNDCIFCINDRHRLQSHRLINDINKTKGENSSSSYIISKTVIKNSSRSVINGTHVLIKLTCTYVVIEKNLADQAPPSYS